MAEPINIIYEQNKFPVFVYDASSAIDNEKHRIISLLIEGINNKREKRLRGEARVPSNKYRSSWCAFLREFWADVCIATIIGKGDHKSIKIKGYPNQNGLKWIIQSISEYIFCEFFFGHSVLMFYECPNDEFDADTFSDNFDINRASLPIFTTDVNDISKTIFTNLCCSDRNNKRYKVNLNVKKKTTVARYDIYIIKYYLYLYNSYIII